MNPLYQQQQQQQQSQPQNQQRPSFKEFYDSMTAEKAQNQIEQMLQSGALTQQQLAQAKQQVQALASLFNLK